MLNGGGEGELQAVEKTPNLNIFTIAKRRY